MQRFKRGSEVQMSINVSRAWAGGSLSGLPHLNTVFIANSVFIVVYICTAPDD